ncbi:MAG: 16S rRNA (cytosine(1402)-N(4))-methyltransferase RsmH [Hyphomicrobiales bacterium]|nr:16S rRNA (cytosine(1402)-N(4))-methyltransferase RsmH [Hyphomicrobiales bacterium]
MTGERKHGGPLSHKPVMLSEVMAHLAPRPGEIFVDGTFGAGGYTSALLDAGAIVMAIDRDPSAIAAGRDLEVAAGDRLKLVEGRFSDLDSFAGTFGFAPADGVVFDVGVSSMQLDDPERGFSFRHDGPLNMRMEGGGVSAADVVNRAPVKALARIIGVLGEEKHAGRIARAIDAARRQEPITGTRQLAAIVETAAHARGPQRIHPATRTFQGLRIFINRELEEIAMALTAAEAILKEGGRLVVVAFHSLEDRIVKRFLQARSRESRGSRHGPQAVSARPSFTELTRRPVEPGPDEIAANPRARSARLRAAIRTAAPAHMLDMKAAGVPVLAGISGPETYA